MDLRDTTKEAISIPNARRMSREDGWGMIWRILCHLPATAVGSIGLIGGAQCALWLSGQ